jgi:hypothetical protein
MPSSSGSLDHSERYLARHRDNPPTTNSAFGLRHHSELHLAAAPCAHNPRGPSGCCCVVARSSLDVERDLSATPCLPYSASTDPSTPPWKYHTLSLASFPWLVLHTCPPSPRPVAAQRQSAPADYWLNVGDRRSQNPIRMFPCHDLIVRSLTFS